MGSITLTPASPGTWEVPAGVTSITVRGTGPGGRGTTRTNAGTGGGTGGGGGAVAIATLTVTPLQTVWVSIPAGASTGTTAADCWLSTAGNAAPSGATVGVLAAAGESVPDNSQTGGAGGLASASIGPPTYSGGAGFNGGTGAGGGGSSAGSAAAGASATSATGATAPTDGGNGGAGTANGNSVAGSVPGGGGGGSSRTSGGTRTGGSGGDAQILITWTDPAPVAFSGTVEPDAGAVGVPYSLALASFFSGDLEPFSYALRDGALPDGLTLDGATGVISGTPTTAGVAADLQVRATDQSANVDDTNVFSITIEAPPPPPPPPSGPRVFVVTIPDGASTPTREEIVAGSVGVWSDNIALNEAGTYDWPTDWTGPNDGGLYRDAFVIRDAEEDLWGAVSLSPPWTAESAEPALEVANATHAHSADSLALSSDTALAASDASHGHAADALTLSAAYALTVDDATHAHAADSLALDVGLSLTVADATHAHTADAPVLTAAETLAVQGATHAHAADALVLAAGEALAVQDATHGHAADNITLDVSGAAVLAVQDATHAQTADSLDLATAQAIAIAAALHGHTADAVTLAVETWLAVNGATHGHSADTLTLAVEPALGIADATHGHTAGELALSAAQALLIDGATHGHTADTISFALRKVTLRLLDKAEGGAPLPNLAGIRWAFYESTNPASWGAPVNQGDAVGTDGGGLVTFEFPSTSLGAGDVGMLAATISDGDPAQSPPPRSFLIPVTLE
jgi:hypothetical protein